MARGCSGLWPGVQRALDPNTAYSWDISVMTTDKDQGEAERRICTWCQGPRTGYVIKDRGTATTSGEVEGHGQGCSWLLTPFLHTIKSHVLDNQSHLRHTESALSYPAKLSRLQSSESFDSVPGAGDEVQVVESQDLGMALLLKALQGRVQIAVAPSKHLQSRWCGCASFCVL